MTHTCQKGIFLHRLHDLQMKCTSTESIPPHSYLTKFVNCLTVALVHQTIGTHRRESSRLEVGLGILDVNLCRKHVKGLNMSGGTHSSTCFTEHSSLWSGLSAKPNSLCVHGKTAMLNSFAS